MTGKLAADKRASNGSEKNGSYKTPAVTRSPSDPSDPRLSAANCPLPLPVGPWPIANSVEIS